MLLIRDRGTLLRTQSQLARRLHKLPRIRGIRSIPTASTPSLRHIAQRPIKLHRHIEERIRQSDLRILLHGHRPLFRLCYELCQSSHSPTVFFELPPCPAGHGELEESILEGFLFVEFEGGTVGVGLGGAEKEGEVGLDDVQVGGGEQCLQALQYNGLLASAPVRTHLARIFRQYDQATHVITRKMLPTR